VKVRNFYFSLDKGIQDIIQYIWYRLKIPRFLQGIGGFCGLWRENL